MGRLAWFPWARQIRKSRAVEGECSQGRLSGPAALVRRSGLGIWLRHQDLKRATWPQEACFLICKLGVMTPAIPGPGMPASLKGRLMPWLPGFHHSQWGHTGWNRCWYDEVQRSAEEESLPSPGAQHRSEQASPEQRGGLHTRVPSTSNSWGVQASLSQPPEIQNPYSKEEPFDKTQTLLCSNASFNPKYLRRTLFQEIPQAETSSPQFKLLACSHPLWDVIGLA